MQPPKGSYLDCLCHSNLDKYKHFHIFLGNGYIHGDPNPDFC